MKHYASECFTRLWLFFLKPDMRCARKRPLNKTSAPILSRFPSGRQRCASPAASDMSEAQWPGPPPEASASSPSLLLHPSDTCGAS